MRDHTIAVIGGTGFVGQHLIHRLAELGYPTRVLTRRRERHKELIVLPQVTLIEADVHDPRQLLRHTVHCNTIISLAGILNESGAKNSRFKDVHVDLPRNLLKAAQANGAQRLLHMSALNAGITGTKSHYLRSKGEGEKLVHDAGGNVEVISFRPSVIFGPADHFFTRFKFFLSMSPLVFPLACPNARFSPVYVGNVVDAFIKALQDKSMSGNRYDLCGPREYSLQELVQYTARICELKPHLLGLNDGLSRLQAKILGLMPGRPFTMDNYYSLQHPSVCTRSVLETLAIKAASVEEIVPSYIANRRVRARYNDWRRDAGRR